VEGAGGQWSLLTQEDPVGRLHSAALPTGLKSRRTGSAAEAPDQLMFTVNQRAAIRPHARLRAPSTRDRRYAAGPAQADGLPLGADRKLLRIDRGSNLVPRVPLAVAIGSQRDAQTMVSASAPAESVWL
jgi:hypothetical protein